ncbi:MAG: twin-arginine translocase TatA/TatE family subunit [Candidatus Desulforudis sp.]|nr:twin-arginine translocase TatA/TatE family subunit [Desulforudis sp.]
MLPFNIGFPELILILVIIIVILGPGRLPQLGKAIGRTVKSYRKEANEGLPPPDLRRRRRPAGDLARAQTAAATAAKPPLSEPEVVEDPARRGMLTGVLRVFQLIWKVWRWRRRLP